MALDMYDIEFYTDKLSALIKADRACPDWSEIKITENIRYEEYFAVVDWRQLNSVKDYQARFTELCMSGYSWINLTAIGIQKGMLVVAVELPSNVVGCPQPSINISGFSTQVIKCEYQIQVVNG